MNGDHDIPTVTGQIAAFDRAETLEAQLCALRAAIDLLRQSCNAQAKLIHFLLERQQEREQQGGY
jgi:hypothetical protein